MFSRAYLPPALKNLIIKGSIFFKATKDLDELDKQRREEFKNYELEKEHERREHLKELPEDERKKEEQKYDELKKKHKDHPKLHHPVRLSIDKMNMYCTYIGIIHDVELKTLR